MQVRFFNDWDPADPTGKKPRLLIGLSPEDPDIGEKRDAVRVATPDDQVNFAAAYAVYEEVEKEKEKAKEEAAKEAEHQAAAAPAAAAGGSSARMTGRGSG